ncbi:MAG: CDP-diacylglycerol--glycerol-3-phosphate 3-phosphatidyltransferase, partial [Polyangiaceae bacterium]
IALVIGYPYRLVYGAVDLGVIDMQRVGRAWIYLSLVFSVASAAQYARLFAEAVDAKDRKRSG